MAAAITGLPLCGNQVVYGQLLLASPPRRMLSSSKAEEA
jgi:hypothetical protein